MNIVYQTSTTQLSFFVIFIIFPKLLNLSPTNPVDRSPKKNWHAIKILNKFDFFNDLKKTINCIYKTNQKKNPPPPKHKDK